MPTDAELAGRLLIAAVLAGLLGVEREMTDQPAGMRTHILLGVGAALFAIVSGYGFQHIVHDADSARVRVDVSRVAAQIASGIGFIGGGAILKYGASIRGLTTAASLWVTAAIGTAVGVGLIWVSVATTAIVLVALAGLRPVRGRLRAMGKPRHELVIDLEHDANLTAVLDALTEAGVEAPEVRVERGEEESLRIFARLPRRASANRLAELLARRDGVREVDWT